MDKQAQLSLKITGDSQGVKAAAGEAEAALNGVGKAATKAATDATAAGARIDGALAPIPPAATKAGAAVGEIGVAATKAATEAAAAGAKIGQSLGGITSNATAAATAAGHARSGFLGMAGGIQGMAGAAIAFKAVDLVGELKATATELQNVRYRLEFFAASQAEAAGIQADLRQTARDLNADYLVLADTYAKLLPIQQSGVLTGQETKDILVGMTNAGAALGASNEQLKQSFFGLAQGLGSPILHAEELNQVVEPLPGLLQAMDRAANLPAGGFRKMVNEGKVTSEFFKTTFIGALKEFDGASAKTADGFDAASRRVEGAWQRLAAQAEKPLNFVVNLSSKAFELAAGASAIPYRIVNGAVDAIANAGKKSAEALKAELAKLESEAPAATDRYAFQRYTQQRADLVAAIAKAEAEAAAAAPKAPPKGFEGPTIADEELKKRQDQAKATAKALTDSKIELLKAQKDYSAALAMEAEQRGLEGEDAKKWIATELATIKAREDAAAATKAQTEAERQRAKDIRDSQQTIAAQFAEDRRLDQEDQAQQLAAAGDNAQARLEIERRFAAKAHQLKVEELNAQVDTLKMLGEANASESDTADIKRTILKLQAEIASEQRIAAAEAKTFADKGKQLNDDQAKSLKALGDAAKLAQDQLAAAQGALAGGGGADNARTAADAVKAQADLAARVADARKKYSDPAAQDQAEAYVRAQAAAQDDLERITREGADRQTSYWVGAWEQAGRSVHDALTDMFSSILDGETGSIEDFLGNIRRTSNRVAANMAAGVVEDLFRGVVPGAVSTPASLYPNNLATGTAASPATVQLSSSSISGLASAAWNTVRDWVGTSTPAAATVADQNSAAFASGKWDNYDPTEGTATAGETFQGAGLGSGTNWGNVASQMAPFATGALAQMITPNVKFAPYMADKSVLQVQGITSDVADALGNLGGWFSLLKLVRPLLGMHNNLYKSAFPDRKMGIESLFLGLGAGWLAPIVKSGAGYNWSDRKGLMLSGAYEQTGAPLDALLAGGDALSKTLLRTADVLGVSLGQFSVEMRNRGDRFWLNAYGTDGKAFAQIGEDRGIRLTPENLQGQLGLLQAALIKRDEVLKQFDDRMMRSAIRAGEDLSQISDNLKAVQRLRLFTGDATELGGQLTKERTQYGTMSRTIAEFAPRRQRRAEQARLDVAYQLQFQGEVDSYMKSLAEFGGGTVSNLGASVREVMQQTRQLIAQNNELAEAAKRSKGKLQYTAIPESEIRAAMTAALDKVRTAILAPIREQLAADIAAVQQSLTGSTTTVLDLSARIGAGLAALPATLDAGAIEQKVSDISALVQQRYQLELAAIQGTVEAAKGLKETVAGLSTSDLSPLKGPQQFAAAQLAYQQSLNAFNNGDRSADTINKVRDTGLAYLQEAKDMFPSGTERYTQVFNSVNTVLGRIADQGLTAQGEVADVQARAVEVLDKLQDYLNSQTDSIKAQIDSMIDNTLATAENTKALNGAKGNPERKRQLAFASIFK